MHAVLSFFIALKYDAEIVGYEILDTLFQILPLSPHPGINECMISFNNAFLLLLLLK